MEYPFTALVGQEPLKTALLPECRLPGHRRRAGPRREGHRQKHRRAAPCARCCRRCAWSRAARSTATRTRRGRTARTAAQPASATPSNCPCRSSTCRSGRRRTAFSARSTSSAPCAKGGAPFNRACWQRRTAASCTSTRSICCRTTWSTCCSTPRRWASTRCSARASSATHPARFLLIGTMNREEGDLRPQLLDRFGLMVEVAGPRDREQRAEVVRRRLAYRVRSDRVRRSLGRRAGPAAPPSRRGAGAIAAGAARRWLADCHQPVVLRIRGRWPARRHRHAQDGTGAGCP